MARVAVILLCAFGVFHIALNLITGCDKPGSIRCISPVESANLVWNMVKP